jgi:hypothetical protein
MKHKVREKMIRNDKYEIETDNKSIKSEEYNVKIKKKLRIELKNPFRLLH